MESTSIKLDPEMLKAFDAIAQKKHSTRSQVIREVLWNHLESQRKK